MKHILIALLVVSCTACVNNYARFYTPVPDTLPTVIASNRVAPPPATPLVEHTSNQDLEPYNRRGYVPIGFSNFWSTNNESDQGAVDQGRKIGADLVVIVNPIHSGSVTTHVPVTSPTRSTSYTSGSATAYGLGGIATAYGNSTTTTYGSQTSYIPMTLDRYNYSAAYFVKRRYILGAMWRDLTNEERAERQSNSGIYITLVVNDTPAFQNDVLAGDILIEMDGVTIYGQQAASDIITRKRGEEVKLTIFRKGQLIEKRLKLAP